MPSDELLLTEAFSPATSSLWSALSCMKASTGNGLTAFCAYLDASLARPIPDVAPPTAVNRSPYVMGGSGFAERKTWLVRISEFRV
jgi:hypothetical protein